MRYVISTDGGAFKKDSGFDAVAAYQIYEEGKLIYREGVLLEDKTSNYGEIFALFKALKAISSYIKYSGTKKAEVFVVTDSELCFKSLTKWMTDWLEKANSPILVNSSNKAVANQEVIKMAYIHMLQLEKMCKFKLCHINSHESVNNMEKLRKKFNKTNKTKFTEEEFEVIFIANYETDKLVKMTYEKYTQNND